MNIQQQLETLDSFNYSHELEKFPLVQTSEYEFYYNNKGFEAGDSEMLYSLIRFYKPNKIIKLAVEIPLLWH